ncbi:MAG: AAA family ATPase [Clostridia bacterium]|nr:AAA family ATPase [Clostridia bacterium]
MIISLIGMPGCGKTSIGKELALKLDMDFLDIDQFIEKNYQSIDSLFAVSEAHFREIESKALKECLLQDNTVLSTGGGIILSKKNRELLRKHSSVFFINREIDDIIASTDFTDRPLLKNNSSKIHELYRNRIDKYYETAHYIINSNNVFDDTINKILQNIDK